MTRAILLAGIVPVLAALSGPVLAAPDSPRAAQTPAASAPSPSLDIAGADLGMTLKDWMALPPPRRAGPTLTAVCPDDPAAAKAAGLVLTAAEQKAGMRACTYVDRDASLVEPQGFDWTQDVKVQGARYYFSGGRLARIETALSIDAFDRVMAMLKSAYGPPAETVRGEVKTRVGAWPKVEVRWRTPSGAIDLTDPLPNLSQMQVVFTARAAQVPPITAASR